MKGKTHRAEGIIRSLSHCHVNRRVARRLTSPERVPLTRGLRGLSACCGQGREVQVDTNREDTARQERWRDGAQPERWGVVSARRPELAPLAFTARATLTCAACLALSALGVCSGAAERTLTTSGRMKTMSARYIRVLYVRLSRR